MGGPPPPGLEGRLFPPELVMRYQREIGLTEAQQKKITKELQALQTKVVELQFSLQKEVGAMTKLLEATAIDEAVTLKQAERVMSVEHEIKQLHLRTLIRIKNALTAEQIAALEKKRPPMGPGPGRGGRP
jgi:Spy/CpxP family protein refolding chaperone